MTWLPLIFGIAIAISFVLGRIWQIRCDLEQERAGDFTTPPVARIPHPTNRTEPFWASYDC